MAITYSKDLVGKIVLIDNKRVRRIIEATKTNITVLVSPQHALDGETETIPLKYKNLKIITVQEAAKILTS